MVKKIKNESISKIHQTLKFIVDSQDKKPFEFTRCIVKNKKIFEEESKIIEDMFNKMKEFNDARANLINKYSEKDENGNPKITDNQYSISNPAVFKDELTKLIDSSVEYKEYLEFLKKETEIEVVEIPAGSFPKEIEPWIVEILDFMIKD